jgi:pimeloyl-ACP methyl ester carboxylesterase
MKRPRLSRLLGLAMLLGCTGCGTVRNALLFHPTHEALDNGLAKWRHEGALLGFARPAENPAAIWLVLHGNGGQASGRGYMLPVFAERDSVYILEYPGYGQRAGKPGRTEFDAAAREGYRALRAAFPGRPVGVVGESLGSGPACALASDPVPPDKIVLIVPFDRLSRVARVHAGALAARLLLGNSWDNVAALAHYRGPVEIFGAAEDTVIPVDCARTLAAGCPQAVFHLIPGGHNDWPRSPEVRVRLSD